VLFLSHIYYNVSSRIKKRQRNLFITVFIGPINVIMHKNIYVIKHNNIYTYKRKWYSGGLKHYEEHKLAEQHLCIIPFIYKATYTQMALSANCTETKICHKWRKPKIVFDLKRLTDLMLLCTNVIM
jgi:hypothetical protein